jgi:hypothetical protein
MAQQQQQQLQQVLQLDCILLDDQHPPYAATDATKVSSSTASIKEL